jgi:ferredoxin-NADP reductase
MVESSVREHVSQHDAIDALPLITTSATVTEVERIDRDRRSEVTKLLTHWIEEANLDGDYGSVSEPSDWAGLGERLLDADESELARQVATLTERYRRPKPMLVRARFEPDIDFLAGQYVGLTYNGVPRAYSIANSPTEDELEICVRRVPGGNLSPQLCDDLAVGNTMTIRGPYGELVLQDRSPRDMVFLATGTGVAPFKGMIDYVFETGRDEFEGQRRDVWLFLGTAWIDDLPYREAFRELDRIHDNFHFVPCLSREPILSDWDGETDYVQHALLKHVDPAVVAAPLGKRLERWLRQESDSNVERRLDPDNVDVYACGINAMVYSLVGAVERLGVPPGRIESEGFG